MEQYTTPQYIANSEDPVFSEFKVFPLRTLRSNLKKVKAHWLRKQISATAAPAGEKKSASSQSGM